MNDDKITKVNAFREYLQQKGIKFREKNNGHFQITQGTKVILQYWATTEKFHIAHNNEWGIGLEAFKMILLGSVTPDIVSEDLKEPEKIKTFPLAIKRKACKELINKEFVDTEFINNIMKEICFKLLKEAENICTSGCQITINPLRKYPDNPGTLECKATIDYMGGMKNE